MLELTLTVNEDGVEALAAALVESHGEPAVTCTVKVTPLAPDALATLILWAPGLEPCAVVNASVVGDTVTFPELPLPLVTVKVTGTF